MEQTVVCTYHGILFSNKNEDRNWINLRDKNNNKNHTKNLNLTYCNIFISITVLNDEILELEYSFVCQRIGLWGAGVRGGGEGWWVW